MNDVEAIPQDARLTQQINDSLDAAGLVIVPRDILTEDQLACSRKINLKRVDQGDEE